MANCLLMSNRTRSRFPRTPAVTTASLPSVLTCVIKILLTGTRVERPLASQFVMDLCTPPVLETHCIRSFLIPMVRATYRVAVSRPQT